MGLRRAPAGAAALALVALAACGGGAPVAGVKAPAQERRAAPSGRLRLPIMMYHHVGAAGGKWRPLYVALPQFSRQMAALAKDGVATLTIEDLYRAVHEGRVYSQGAVALTFDDGTADQYSFVYPILKQYRMRATLYVAPGLIGRPGYLSWAQAREMAASGLIEFGAHTVSHADLAQLSRAEAAAEISGSRRILEQRLGRRVRHFAYPYGHHNEEIVSLVRDAGFLTATTTKYEWSHGASSSMRWGRMTIHDTQTPANLASLAKASGSWVS